MVESSSHTTKLFNNDHPSGNVIQMDSVPNLRRVDTHGKLYRSSRQDRASHEDIQRLSNLGIRSYLDCRNSLEYRNIDGGRLKAIDRVVQVLVPDIPDPKLVKPYPANGAIRVKRLNGKPISTSMSLSPKFPRRYLINMFSKEMMLEIFNKAPLYTRLLSLLLIIIDVILGNHCKYFLHCLSDEIIKHGLVGRYVGFLKYGGKEICFILKTLSNPENLPAMLCCTHGKDRTGIVAALVLSILGKSDEYIAEDYAMSEEGLKPIMPEMLEELLKYIPDESFSWARRETILKVLHTTRDMYRSVENYLESIGFGKEDQAKLRQVLS